MNLMAVFNYHTKSIWNVGNLLSLSHNDKFGILEDIHNRKQIAVHSYSIIYQFSKKFRMTIDVKSKPVLISTIGTFCVLLIYLYHANREVLHQTNHVINGKATLEQAHSE